MTTPRKGLLAIWTDVAPSAEADFNEWYNREHIPERADNEGFRNARRYVAVEGVPRYFAAYDTEALASLGSPAYAKALANQTPWSRRQFPQFSNFTRIVAELVGDLGRGAGGAVLTVRMEPSPSGARELAEALAGAPSRALYERPGIVRVSVALGVAAALGEGEAAEVARRAASAPDAVALLLEGADVPALQAAAADVLHEQSLADIGAHTVLQLGLYQYQYGIFKGEL